MKFSDFHNSFNTLADAIHQSNVAAGWWVEMNRCFYRTMMLVVTEVAEATEGERKNLMDDKLPHRRMGEVELADTLIRLFDLAGNRKWKYLESQVPAIDESFHDNFVKDDQTLMDISGKHFFIVELIVELAAADRMSFAVDQAYTRLVRLILRISHQHGYDVMSALFEKWEFNKTRVDHTREARAAKNGKRF